VKRFEGHKVSGNHIHCNISVDGSVVSTGSADGKVHLYNWYSSKTIRVLPAHNKAPCTEAVFHPLLPSVLASCGWDKRIHIFQ
jgi:WD40 repeat protein